ncbi:methyltransferase [Apiospora hydei]|uniref:Methyltransferase n=1 Tax=Apiospora hydei TaxID=1337664 RepID=A0ABR1X7I7_9PEZI
MSSSEKGPISREIYTERLLYYIYDWLVLGFNMKYLWRCPTKSVLLPFFKENFSANHLDCGVATGYFPAACLESSGGSKQDEEQNQRLALLDFNPNCLRTTERAILSRVGGRRRRPIDIERVEADVTAPLPAALQDAKFRSISMFNLLHCVPGGAAHKVQSFRTLGRVLDPDGGVLVGCTVLGEQYAARWWLSRLAVRHMNRVGVFHNLDDNREDIEKALGDAFEDVQTWLVGMTLLFKASKPRANL